MPYFSIAHECFFDYNKVHTMIINYYGDGSFRLQSGETSLLIDPQSNRLKADVTLRTELPRLAHTGGNGVFAGEEIAFPGEYEVKEIEITGLPVKEEGDTKMIRTIYVVLWEEISFAIVGKGVSSLDAATLEHLHEPDVLFVAVGDGAMSPEHVAKAVKQLEPSFVIPASEKTPTEFLKIMGQKPEAQEKLVFKKKDLEVDSGRVVLLEPKN
jgi:L-ascorbate metabolism protein UlaG (beta-lactamase superfamily)